MHPDYPVRRVGLERSGRNFALKSESVFVIGGVKMRRFRKGKYGGRAFSHIWNAFKQLNPKNVEAESKRVVRVGVLGPLELLKDTAAFLLGEDVEAYGQAGDVLVLLPTPLEDSAFSLLPRCDVVLQSRNYRDTLPGVASERIFAFSSKEDLPSVIREVLQEVDLGYAHIPLARVLPAFRSEVALGIIQGISIENAIFVASTSLGNVIPNPLQPLTSVAESLGDLVVLTANQLRMLFRLAAAYNQSLGYKQQVPEVLSIVVAAFGWRSVARELAGKIPLGAGVVSKAAIAFAGTWALGDGIAYYYTTGKHLSKEELRQRFEAAYETGKSAAEVVVAKFKESYAPSPAAENRPGRIVRSI